MNEARSHPREDFRLFVDRQEMGEILQIGDRKVLRKWVSQLRFEGPNISMSIAEYLWIEWQKMRDLKVADQRKHLMELEIFFLRLKLHDFKYGDRESQVQRLGDVLRTSDTFDMLFGEYPWFEKFTISSPAMPEYILPLKHRRYKKNDDAYTINPGPIGRNFVHTWALDLLNVTGFYICRGKPNKIAIYSDKTASDTLTVIDSCGNVLQKYGPLDFDYTRFVDLQNRPPCKYDAQHQPFTRIYLILETSNAQLLGGARWFKIEQLEHVSPLRGDECVYVVADEINYDYFDTSIQPPNNEDFVEALDGQGKPFPLYPPWAGGAQGANSRMSPEFKTMPSFERGWYLLGLNTTYVDQKFYSVVYYNERIGKLRIYLYNLDEDTEFTAHKIKVCLEGITSMVTDQPNPDLPPRFLPKWEYLKGAFFPLDPNPKNWSNAEVIVDGWAPHTWTALEIDMLYPMGSDFPAVGDIAVGYASSGRQPVVGSRDLACNKPWRPVSFYRSLYEDQFTRHQKNTRLVIIVRTIHQGTADFELLATAVGKAFQTSSPKGAADLKAGISQMFDGIKTGKDWYGYANDFGKLIEFGLDKGIENLSGSALKAAKDMKKNIGTTFNVIGAVAAYAGIVLKAMGVLSNDLLTLSISLSIYGKIGGTLTFIDVERVNRFYLPGRFSMADAILVDGIKSDNFRATIDSCLPRYDRSLGLFGYAYPPWESEVNINIGLRLPQAIMHSKNYVGPLFTEDGFYFPARFQVEYSTGNRGQIAYEKDLERLLPDLIPVIINPQAEIEVIPAQESKTYVYNQELTLNSSEIYITAHDRALMRCWSPEMEWYAGDPYWFLNETRGTADQYIFFSNNSIKKTPPNPNLPPLRVDVIALEKPQLETGIKPFKTQDFYQRRGLHVKATTYLGSYLNVLTPSYDVKYSIYGDEKFDPNAQAPMLLTDIIYTWKLMYLFWGESRYPPEKAIPKIQETILSSPITMRCPQVAPPADKMTFLGFLLWLSHPHRPLGPNETIQELWSDYLDYLMEGDIIESSLLRL